MAKMKTPAEVLTKKKKLTTPASMARKKILDQVLAIWMNFPTLRLGQLIENARLTVGMTTQTNKDLFYLDDKELLEILKSYAATTAAKNKDKDKLI